MDEIIAEVWRNRGRQAEKYAHDLDAIASAMQERERKSKAVFVRRNKSRKAGHGATLLKDR